MAKILTKIQATVLRQVTFTPYTDAGNMVKSNSTTLCKTCFQTILPDSPSAHYTVTGKTTDLILKAFSDFVTRVMSYLMVKRTQRQTPASKFLPVW